MADLLDDDFRLAAIDTLYRCHDHLLGHREALFTHLKERWSGLFGASYDILLYDLTSTYFEVDANGPVTETSKLKAFGYSRDKRPDCVQIVIALIITPDGLPIGYGCGVVTGAGQWVVFSKFADHSAVFEKVIPRDQSAIRGERLVTASQVKSPARRQEFEIQFSFTQWVNQL